jgi:hypothetical protein
MSDENAEHAAPRAAINGADYRVRARHPRRDGPLVITDAATGKLIAQSGDLCTLCTQEQLASMINNGYIERVDGTETPAPPAPAPAPVAPPTPSRPRRRAQDREA